MLDAPSVPKRAFTQLEYVQAELLSHWGTKSKIRSTLKALRPGTGGDFFGLNQ